MFNIEPFLSNTNETQQIIILTAFAARVRTGHYGRGNTVKAASVQEALSAISKTIELAGKSSPLYKAEKAFKVPVARLLEGYKRQDPPPVPQLALPVKVSDYGQKQAYKSNCNKL